MEDALDGDEDDLAEIGGSEAGLLEIGGGSRDELVERSTSGHESVEGSGDESVGRSVDELVEGWCE